MAAYAARRLVSLLPILFVMSLTIFIVLRLVPGDPARAMVGLDADPAAYQEARKSLGLDDPLYVQYTSWLGKAIKGDFGRSQRNNEEVSKMIGDRLPLTAQLTLMASVLAIAISVPLGTLAGANRGSWIDHVASIFAASGVAIPSFWLALLLITLFSIKLGWLPAFGWVPFDENPVESVKSLTLPAIALAMPPTAILTRMVRSTVLEAMGQDYVRTARAKGLRERRVVLRHVLRNSLIPVLTLLGLILGQMLSGAIIIEVVFALPGIGRLAVDAILFRELVVVQGIVLLVAVITVLLNLAVDISYGIADPRVRLG